MLNVVHSREISSCGSRIRGDPDPLDLVLQTDPGAGSALAIAIAESSGLVVEHLHADAEQPVGQDLVVVLAVSGHQVGQHERQRRLAGLTGTDARRILVAPGSVDGGPVQEEVDLVAVPPSWRARSGGRVVTVPLPGRRRRDTAWIMFVRVAVTAAMARLLLIPGGPSALVLDSR